MTIRLQMDSTASGEACRQMKEATRYAYTTTCAVLLHQLYADAPYDKDFKLTTINHLVLHLQQSPQICNVAVAISDGAGITEAHQLISVIHEDPFIQHNGTGVIVSDFIALELKEGHYDSRTRVLLLSLARCLDVSRLTVEGMEAVLLKTFEEKDHKITKEEKEEQESKDRKRKFKRYALIGLATVGGGTLLGLTGGLAAPLIAASAGAIIGTAGATALGSVAGVAIIGSLFGAAGAGLGGYKMNRRMGGIEEFEFDVLTDGSQLNLTIAITGWLLEDTDFRHIWAGLAHSCEQYVLKYESRYLRQMGEAFEYLLKLAMQATAQELLKLTVLSGVLSAIAWPLTFVSAAFLIDNPWSVCAQRAEAVGKQLANVLLARQQGKRPVTLIGFSLGARVIYFCLKEMSKRSNCEGIVEDAVMLGAPVSGHGCDWNGFGKVVAGRIVNGYCSSDWILRFLYRTASLQYTVAGLQPIAWDDRRMENVDLKDVVEGHLDYMNKIDILLQKVGIRTCEHAARGKASSLGEFVRVQKGKRSTQDKQIGPETANLDRDESSSVGLTKTNPADASSSNEKKGVGLTKTNLADTSSSNEKKGVGLTKMNLADTSSSNEKKGVGLTETNLADTSSSNEKKGVGLTKTNLADVPSSNEKKGAEFDAAACTAKVREADTTDNEGPTGFWTDTPGAKRLNESDVAAVNSSGVDEAGLTVRGASVIDFTSGTPSRASSTDCDQEAVDIAAILEDLDVNHSATSSKDKT